MESEQPQTQTDIDSVANIGGFYKYLDKTIMNSSALGSGASKRDELNLFSNAAIGLSSEQAEIAKAEFEYLANVWLDEFERKILDGKTISEFLNTM